MSGGAGQRDFAPTILAAQPNPLGRQERRLKSGGEQLDQRSREKTVAVGAVQ